MIVEYQVSFISNIVAIARKFGLNVNKFVQDVLLVTNLMVNGEDFSKMKINEPKEPTTTEHNIGEN